MRGETGPDADWKEAQVMAEYLILIYDDEAALAAADEQTIQRLLAEHGRFMQRHAAALRGGHRLRATDTATSLRYDVAGPRIVTDGAFAETKEALGGYYLIEATDLDEAIAVADQVPALFGGVEVRPIWPTSGQG